MEFTEKLTVMFYSEVIGDEVNGNAILGKNGRKRGFFGMGCGRLKFLKLLGLNKLQRNAK
jgi:hypothetical protein